MTAYDQRQRDWLLDLGRRVSRRLRSRLAIENVVLIPPSHLRAIEGDADGWYVELGRVRGDRGSGLQLWLDRWPRTPTRKVWFGYKGTREDQIKIAAHAGTPEFGPATILSDGAFRFDPEQAATLLTSRLSAFGRPVAERYSDTWSFYGVYLRRTPDFARQPPERIVNRSALFLERVGLAIAGQIVAPNGGHDNAIEGHPLYRQHIIRERCAALARQAKIRDGYTCRICGINFEQLYGVVGHAFAEAHHIVPLNLLKRPRRTVVGDLISVCANCHRMLHRLPATMRSAMDSLRRRFTAAWPEEA
jgi:hypothetical protein